METFEAWNAPYWGDGLLAVLGIGVLVIAGLAFIIFIVTDRQTTARTALGAWLGTASAMFLLLSLVAYGILDQDKRDNTYKTENMEKLGYTHVELSGLDFTASKDGKYVRGILHEDDGMFYVLTLP